MTGSPALCRELTWSLRSRSTTALSSHPKLACIVACRDVIFNRQARTVKLQLPVSKTDTEAKGCYRVHKCICDPRHEQDCRDTAPPELFGTAFQKCSCTSGMNTLCVYTRYSRLSFSFGSRNSGHQQPTSLLLGRARLPPSFRSSC